jgi:hypothetical protein
MSTTAAASSPSATSGTALASSPLLAGAEGPSVFSVGDEYCSTVLSTGDVDGDAASVDKSRREAPSSFSSPLRLPSPTEETGKEGGVIQPDLEIREEGIALDGKAAFPLDKSAPRASARRAISVSSHG